MGKAKKTIIQAIRIMSGNTKAKIDKNTANEILISYATQFDHAQNAVADRDKYKVAFETSKTQLAQLSRENDLLREIVEKTNEDLREQIARTKAKVDEERQARSLLEART